MYNRDAILHLGTLTSQNSIIMLNDKNSGRGRLSTLFSKRKSSDSELQLTASKTPISPRRSIHSAPQATYNTAQTPKEAIPSRLSPSLGVRPRLISGHVKTIREKFLAQREVETPARANSPRPGTITHKKKAPWEPEHESTGPEFMEPESTPSRSLPQAEGGHARDVWRQSWAQRLEARLEDTSSTSYSQVPDLVISSQDNKRTANTPSPPSSRRLQPSKWISSHRGRPNPLQPAMSAFEYALVPFLTANAPYLPQNEPPSPTDSSVSIDFPSPLAPPDPDDISIVTEDIHPFPVQNNLPPIVANKNTLETRIKVLHVRTALIRCTVIARSAWELDNSTRKNKSTSAYKEYSKMYKTVDAALHIAQELQSDELLARCFYWRGRACGGQRYWDEAVNAFEKAMQFDSAVVEGTEKEIPSGLTASEKADVKFLKRSAEKRAKYDDAERKRRWEKDEERAWKIANETGEDFENVVVWTRSPPWCPDMEGIMRQWMQATGREEENVELSPELGLDGDWKARGDDHEGDELKWAGRPLTAEEIDYIENGDKTQAPLMRWRCGAHSRSNSILSSRRRRSPPPRIDTSTKKPAKLGIAVHGTSDAEDADRGEMIEIALDDRTPKAKSRSGKTSPQTARRCPDPQQHEVPRLSLAVTKTIIDIRPREVL